MGKILTTIDLCDREVVYKGRLLGLVDDKEFHALIKKKAFRKKVFSGQTIPLADIPEHNPDLTGMRIVLTVSEIDGKSVPGKHLFISERLSYTTTQNNGEVGMLGADDEFYTLIEGVT